jgi:cardiolipin synthase
MNKRNSLFINGITKYRIIAAPVLLGFIYFKHYDIFKWMLALSFFTDLIDGYLARKFKVATIRGSRLDSLGDDLTVFVALIGMFIFKTDFAHEVFSILLILFFLLLTQTVFALVRYKKVTSFHTYLAKLAALLQGVFFITLFIESEPSYFLFYLTAIITG